MYYFYLLCTSGRHIDGNDSSFVVLLDIFFFEKFSRGRERVTHPFDLTVGVPRRRRAPTPYMVYGIWRYTQRRLEVHLRTYLRQVLPTNLYLL